MLKLIICPNRLSVRGQFGRCRSKSEVNSLMQTGNLTEILGNLIKLNECVRAQSSSTRNDDHTLNVDWSVQSFKRNRASLPKNARCSPKGHKT